MNLKLSVVTVSLLLATVGIAQQNQIKRQAQMTGVNAKFGTTYSMSNGFNFAVRGGKYTLDAFDCYMTGTYPNSVSKLVVFEVAFKNARPDNQFLNTSGMFTLVDSDQHTYGLEAIALASDGEHGFSPTLKPGQGMGQASLHDPLRIAFKVPGEAVITELIMNSGRLYTNEKVMRYLISPAPAKPRLNVLEPLPDNVHDTSDKSGAVALKIGVAKLGEYLPSGTGSIKVEQVSSPAGVTCGGGPPDAGKRYVVVKFSAKQSLLSPGSIFNVWGADDVPYLIADADGDQYKKVGVKKPSSDENYQDRRLAQGDEIEFRMFFEVPKDDKLKRLIFGWSNSRMWALDLTNTP